ncbi:MAG: OmpA family protein [Campylobacteraceae bacterium]|jgi:outer membrane protein OmpA-like peptidoglycan-associated protein|nr:OmpA family protein [Campylobacteraceae bacterium]
MKRNHGESIWVSFSDVMTALMVIFMFIAISYIAEVQKRQKERDIVFEEFKATQDSLFAELEQEFKDDFKKWQVILDKDLSIKFANPEVLFESGKVTIRPHFAEILDEFLPRYFNIVLQPKYMENNSIREIRIEGHTDSDPIYLPQYDSDPYIGNMQLSQLRSTEVLKYFRNLDYYKQLSLEDKNNIQFLLTANGLSFGKNLDKNKKFATKSGNLEDKTLSRRVEFRIVTNSAKIVEEHLLEINK